MPRITGAPIQYVSADTSPEALKPSITHVSSKDEIDQLIDRKALEYGVSPQLLRTIVSRESRYNPLAVGDLNYICPKTGKTAPSRGLVQINECWHPEAYKYAADPEFAITFLAIHIKVGECYLWATCPL